MRGIDPAGPPFNDIAIYSNYENKLSIELADITIELNTVIIHYLNKLIKSIL